MIRAAIGGVSWVVVRPPIPSSRCLKDCCVRMCEGNPPLSAVHSISSSNHCHIVLNLHMARDLTSGAHLDRGPLEILQRWPSLILHTLGDMGAILPGRGQSSLRVPSWCPKSTDLKSPQMTPWVGQPVDGPKKLSTYTWSRIHMRILGHGTPPMVPASPRSGVTK